MDEIINHEADLDAISKLRPSSLKNPPKLVIDNSLKRDIITIKESKERIKALEDRVTYVEHILRKNVKNLKELKNQPTPIKKQQQPPQMVLKNK